MPWDHQHTQTEPRARQWLTDARPEHAGWGRSGSGEEWGPFGEGGAALCSTPGHSEKRLDQFQAVKKAIIRTTPHKCH